jgi:RND family efflux transporter MFP subunit
MKSLLAVNFVRSGALMRLTLPWLAAVAITATAQSSIQIPTVAAQAKAVAVGFELDGVVQPVKQSTISAQAGGRIATLLVKAGDKVRAGQLLATIDDREAQTGVQRSQAQVAQAQAELRNAQANFNRTRDLQAKGFVSAAALDTADAQLRGALAGRDQAGAGAQQSALAQGFTRVIAPFEGWVLQTQAEAGDLAVPGKPLLILYAPLPLRAVVQIPMSRASQAQAANQVEVLLPSPLGAPQWVRPVTRTSVPTADPVSQTMEWRLELPTNAAQTLLPGQQVRVRFAAGQAQRMVVPAAAVLRRGELTAVYVATAQGFVLKAVRLGTDHGADGIEVVVGLNPGEQVALDPVRAGLAGAQALPAK